MSTRPERREATVRPLPDGEPVVLRDRLFSQHTRRLDLMLGRLLDDGTGHPRIFGNPFQVDRLRRAQALSLLSDPIDPVAIAEFFGPQPAPRLSNRDGHELVQCSATYAADPAGWDTLAASPELESDGADRLVATRDGVVRGWLRRDGPRWTIETNSLERLRELQELILSAAPHARKVTESSVPMDQLTESTAQAPQPSQDAPPEEMERLREEFVRQHEWQWVDESIPALGGLTPRQAAAQGGAALTELNALLDDFGWAATRPSDMSGGRIRHLLGLG